MPGTVCEGADTSATVSATGALTDIQDAQDGGWLFGNGGVTHTVGLSAGVTDGTGEGHGGNGRRRSRAHQVASRIRRIRGRSETSRTRRQTRRELSHSTGQG